MLESTRVARITRSSFNFFQKISLAESRPLVGIKLVSEWPSPDSNAVESESSDELEGKERVTRYGWINSKYTEFRFLITSSWMRYKDAGGFAKYIQCSSTCWYVHMHKAIFLYEVSSVPVYRRLKGWLVGRKKLLENLFCVRITPRRIVDYDFDALR
jgi:hypothetical protein